MCEIKTLFSTNVSFKNYSELYDNEHIDNNLRVLVIILFTDTVLNYFDQFERNVNYYIRTTILDVLRKPFFFF